MRIFQFSTLILLVIYAIKADDEADCTINPTNQDVRAVELLLFEEIKV